MGSSGSCLVTASQVGGTVISLSPVFVLFLSSPGTALPASGHTVSMVPHRTCAVTCVQKRLSSKLHQLGAKAGSPHRSKEQSLPKRAGGLGGGPDGADSAPVTAEGFSPLLLQSLAP